jgi:hypothetical protein
VSTRVEGIQVEERRVGKQWLITSTELPGLFVAHPDLEIARKSTPGAIRMLRDMAKRHPPKAAAGA